MRVAVVGAGIAGLAAAQKLREQKQEVAVFERECSVGGRLFTARHDGFSWDLGATSISPLGRDLAEVIRSLDTTDLVQLEQRIDLHEGLRVSRGDARRGGIRFAYARGMDRLPQLLANGLDVRLDTNVEELLLAEGHYRVNGEEFDAVILTLPLPTVAPLLWGINESRQISGVQYRPCLSVGLGYESVASPETPYHALLNPGQSHPLTWLSIETHKNKGRAPEGGSAFVAQLSREFSLEQFYREESWLVEVCADFLVRLYGPAFQTPSSWMVKRWKYAQPESLSPFDMVNRHGQRCVLAGDGVTRGRVEEAFDSGRRAAYHLLR